MSNGEDLNVSYSCFLGASYDQICAAVKAASETEAMCEYLHPNITPCSHLQ